MYKDLDKDLLNKSPLNQLGDINVSFLTRFMYSKEDITELDENWTKEYLFNELMTNSDYFNKI